MHDRQTTPERRGARAAPLRSLAPVCCALLACLVTLASPLSLVPGSEALAAPTAASTGESTVGTASTVSPSTVAVGGTLTFTLSGFPQGVTVQILVDDGTLVSQQDAAGGLGVVTEIVVGPDGTAAGAVELPGYVDKGPHWLRFRVSGTGDDPVSEPSVGEYTNKSPYFTVSDVTVIGGEAAAPPTPTLSPQPQTPPPTREESSQMVVMPTAPRTEDAQVTAVEVRSGSFSFLGTGILGLAILVSVLAGVVVFNRWRLARHRREVFRSA